MSLDVYLNMPEVTGEHTGIFIRENGSIKELTRAEWDEKFPDREPIVATTKDCAYSANITHNLGDMADKAGIYQALWRPDENEFEYAYQLVDILEAGLQKLRDNPTHFKKFNPPNGWGSYEVLVDFVQGYLDACKQYPTAKVSAWR